MIEIFLLLFFKVVQRKINCKPRSSKYAENIKKLNQNYAMKDHNLVDEKVKYSQYISWKQSPLPKRCS